MPRSLYLFLILTSSIASPALAQSEDTDVGGIHGFVAIGPGIVPDYEGADSYRVVPLAIASVRYNDMSINIEGLTMRADLIPSRLVSAGPAFNLRLSRDDSAGGRVALLDKIDTAIEVGGFVGLQLGGDQYGQGRVSFDVTALADVSGTHDGLLITGRAAYAAIRAKRLSVSLDAQVTYGNKDYLGTYFGVTAAESGRSGLAAYAPGSSLRDIGAGTTIGYQFSKRWGVIGRLSYDYLLGDARKSPIVQDEGSRGQTVAGLAVSYRF